MKNRIKTALARIIFALFVGLVSFGSAVIAARELLSSNAIF